MRRRLRREGIEEEQQWIRGLADIPWEKLD